MKSVDIRHIIAMLNRTLGERSHLASVALQGSSMNMDKLAGGTVRPFAFWAFFAANFRCILSANFLHQFLINKQASFLSAFLNLRNSTRWKASRLMKYPLMKD